MLLLLILKVSKRTQLIGKSVFIKRPRSPKKTQPDCIILEISVFDNSISADELFAKVLQNSYFVNQLVIIYMENLFLLFELLTIFDDNLKVTSTEFFIADFNLLISEFVKLYI